MNYELERIEALCRERGWSHYKLAKEMKDSANNISNLFRRTTTPSITTLRRVCTAMGITLSEFYSVDGISATLTQDQKELLDHFNLLDSRNRSKAIAYVRGLADCSRDD